MVSDLDLTLQTHGSRKEDSKAQLKGKEGWSKEEVSE